MTKTAERENPYASPEVSDAVAVRPPGPPRYDYLWLLLSFDGRIPRSTFWLAFISSGGVLYATILAALLVLPRQGGIVLCGMVLLPLLAWTSLALQVKRWHDRNKSGWWILVNIIPWIGNLWSFIELGCLRGTYGDNNYGPDPT
jgi:uncharacterized membrane protein YhaH (DUF805 family)